MRRNCRSRLGFEFSSDLSGIHASECEERFGGCDDTGGDLALEGFSFEGLRDEDEEFGGV